MQMKNILLLCGILAKEFNNQVIEDIKKYIEEGGQFDSHTANIDDIRDIFGSCDFFIFRHHRSSPDRFERVVKSAENAFLLKTIEAVEIDKLESDMGVIVANYKDEVVKCEPVLLSNVLTVEAHYSEFLPYYERLQGSRKQRVDEHLYLRMRNFERAAQDAKRLNKAKDKKFDIDFSWQTSLSNEFRTEGSDEHKKKVAAHIDKYFNGTAPKLLPIFDAIFKEYGNKNRLEDYKENKSQQLVDYMFLRKELGVLDRSAWPADQKQADQMKRWLLRGDVEPKELLKEFPDLDKQITNMAVILRKNTDAQLQASWFADRVMEGVNAEHLNLNEQSNLYGNNSMKYNLSMLFMLIV